MRATGRAGRGPHGRGTQAPLVRWTNNAVGFPVADALAEFAAGMTWMARAAGRRALPGRARIEVRHRDALGCPGEADRDVVAVVEVGTLDPDLAAVGRTALARVSSRDSPGEQSYPRR